ncbi:MAG: hypothetical protein ACREPF_04885 [Rhodanobacteraceae bacterium]
MSRLSKRKYNVQVLAIMAVYVALMFLEWPLVGKVGNPGLRAILALLPAVPVVAVIVLAARIVMGGDELEQRMHLLALSVAVGIVSAASIIGAFLAAAEVWHVGGDVLFWVFPALCVTYGVARLLLLRGLTGAWNFWGC